ncbi:hypothetical protein PENSUB_13386 [Penicillium subrubescens]|uniref:HTH CENPB-type domain-containing protein n=1 Tax=Penicillium subrubescens TaxID=1316194 RepID=A0A1Q5SRP4_9EURO|nr:hypothetical protein PENSUB_13386 [Penicillium subrubescens]
MASILLAARCSNPPLTVGKNWPSKFVQQRDELRSRFSRWYDYHRALNVDPNTRTPEHPNTLRAWFTTVQSVINENGIQAEDIYNFGY